MSPSSQPLQCIPFIISIYNMQYLEIPMQVTVEDLGATVSELNVLQRRLKAESNEDESL